MRLAQKVAIVTGGGSGIGAETAKVFAEEGASVVVADWNRDAGEETVTAIVKQGRQALFCYTDVSKAQDVEKLVAAAVQQYGRLDVLFNNAAVQIFGKLADTSEADWDRVLSVNLKGVFLGCKYAIPAMIRSGGGSIINMASVLAVVGDPDLAAYCAAKGGVSMLTKAAALAYGPQGIRVNCISPGDVDTPMVRDYFEQSPNPQALRQEITSKYCLRRIATPRDIARGAVFLASDESSFMTGSMLLLDGGLTSKCY